MKKFNLTSFLVENKLTRLGRLSENRHSNPEYSLNGRKIEYNSIVIGGMERYDSPDYSDAYIEDADYEDDGTPLSVEEIEELQIKYYGIVSDIISDKGLYEAEQPTKNYNKVFKKYGFSAEPGGFVNWTDTGNDIFIWGIEDDSNRISIRLITPPTKPEAIHLSKVLKSSPYMFDLDEYGLEQLGKFLNRVSSSMLNMGGVRESFGEDIQEFESQPISEKEGMAEPTSEVEEDYSKYGSVEELMKQIETSTNEAAMKHKMERVKKAYESIEAKATSLEEGENASFIAPAKLKEMKRSCKELRNMHERLLKEYDKKYTMKPKKS